MKTNAATFLKSLSSTMTAMALGFPLIASADALAQNATIQVERRWNVVVTDQALSNIDTCAAEIGEKTHARVDEILPRIGVILITTPFGDAEVVKNLSCVQTVEEDLPIFTLPVVTSWNVTVREEARGQVAQCAELIRKSTNAEITNVLSTVGIITLTTPTSDSSSVQAVPCVETVEKDEVLSIQ